MARRLRRRRRLRSRVAVFGGKIKTSFSSEKVTLRGPLGLADREASERQLDGEEAEGPEGDAGDSNGRPKVCLPSSKVICRVGRGSMVHGPEGARKTQPRGS